MLNGCIQCRNIVLNNKGEVARDIIDPNNRSKAIIHLHENT